MRYMTSLKSTTPAPVARPIAQATTSTAASGSSGSCCVPGSPPARNPAGWLRRLCNALTQSEAWTYHCDMHPSAASSCCQTMCVLQCAAAQHSRFCYASPPLRHVVHSLAKRHNAAAAVARHLTPVQGKSVHFPQVRVLVVGFHNSCPKEFLKRLNYPAEAGTTEVLDTLSAPRRSNYHNVWSGCSACPAYFSSVYPEKRTDTFLVNDMH